MAGAFSISSPAIAFTIPAITTPRSSRRLQEELERQGPAMLQSHVPELAGELAGQLCDAAGGRLQKVFFCSSGSEGDRSGHQVFPRAHRAGPGCFTRTALFTA